MTVGKTIPSTAGVTSHTGMRQYYQSKIEELQHVLNEKGQNLRRLQAQRNELNAKGKFYFYFAIKLTAYLLFFFQSEC